MFSPAVLCHIFTVKLRFSGFQEADIVTFYQIGVNAIIRRFVLEHILWQQGYRTIYSVVTGTNTGSVAFHQKVGYEIFATFPNCGYKFGQNLDVIWLQKQSNAVEMPTKFPVPWTCIVENDEKLRDILAILSLS